MDGTLTADEIIISGKFKGKSGKSIRLDAGASADAEITYEVLAIENGSSINGIVKKIVSPAPIKKQPLPNDKKKKINNILHRAKFKP